MRLRDLDIDEIFQCAFTHAGSAVVDCHCGRIHVAINSPYFRDEPEDLQMYVERAKTDNTIILDHQNSSISLLSISDVPFASDCECKGWAPYRELIFKNRTDIKYFLIKLAEEAQHALEVEQTFNILKTKTFKIIDEPEF